MTDFSLQGGFDLGSAVPQCGEAPKSIVESKQLVALDAIINWMILNPGKSVTKAAKANGGPLEYSATWIKMAASSDAFKARLVVKQREVDEALMIPQLKEKLAAATEAAVERLGEVLAVTSDADLLLDGTELLLKTHYQLEAPAQKGHHMPAGIQVESATIVIQQEREAILRGAYVSTKEVKDAQLVESRVPTTLGGSHRTVEAESASSGSYGAGGQESPAALAGPGALPRGPE